MVGIELVVEAKWREECCIRASTPVEVHSTEVVTGHESETSEMAVEFGMEMDKTMEEVRTRKDEQGTPRRHMARLVGVVVAWDDPCIPC